MNYSIIPNPYSIKETEGIFRFQYDTKLVLNGNCGEKELFYARLLNTTIEEKMGFSLKISKGAAEGINEIYLKLLEDNQPIPDTLENEKELKIRQAAYRLGITEQGIVIEACYSQGLLYGIQTLRQLISQLCMTLPCLEIEDKPVIANRGFYHDATRGRVEKLAAYKKLAEKCAYYKLNQLQLYVEHSFMFKDFSEVWRDDTPLTAEDILELDSYCKKLGVELVPSIASFGHLDKVLKTKSFTELCELPDSDKDRFSFRGRMEHHTINMTDPAAWEFIKKMLDEFIPLFSSGQFNLCGDETFDLGKGKSKQLAEEIGTHRIYVDFVKKICEYLVERGLRPMFWGDIIVESPELIKELPKETICLTWGYSERESDRSAGRMDEVGATQYLCPGVHGWRHLINKTSSAYANISRMCEYAKKYKALGLLNTDWGDYGHLSDPAFSIQGLIYGAEGSWSREMPTEAELNRRISLVEYGDNEGKFADIISALGDFEAASWGNVVDIYEYCRDRAPLTSEEQDAFWKNLWISDIEVKNEWLQQYMNKLSDSVVGLNAGARELVYSYLLHARGQQLFNLAVACIGDIYFQADLLEDRLSKADQKALAAEIEKWFTDYKENFRRSSRESEMYRVQEVVFWYADTLRG